MNLIPIAIAAGVLFAGCSKPIQKQPQITGADGSAYVLVQKGGTAIGSVVEADLYQKVGEVGQEKPFYTRRLQAPSDTTPPIFTKVR